MSWGWIGLSVVWVAYTLWQEYRMWRLRQQVQRIISVLSVAGPELNRRIVEGESGTSVKMRDVWRDEVMEEES